MSRDRETFLDFGEKGAVTHIRSLVTSDFAGVSLADSASNKAAARASPNCCIAEQMTGFEAVTEQMENVVVG